MIVGRRAKNGLTGPKGGMSVLMDERGMGLACRGKGGGSCASLRKGRREGGCSLVGRRVVCQLLWRERSMEGGPGGGTIMPARQSEE